jgi:hypothetical protein
LPRTSPAVASESSTLDFKAEHTSDTSEHAKDIAAFANAFGGVVLVGVPEKADSWSRRLMSVAEAATVARNYEDAARDLLAPRPTIDPCVLRCPDDESLALVAINVDPFLGQLIGARVPNTQAWRFPIRTAARHTAYLDPEKFMLYSDAPSRKAAVLLLSIPQPECHLQVQLMYRREYHNGSTTTEELLFGELRSVSVDTNTLTLSVKLLDDSGAIRSVVQIDAPLEDVRAVWKSGSGWVVRLAGTVFVPKGLGGERSAVYLSGAGA